MNGVFYSQESNSPYLSLYLLQFYEDNTVIGVSTSASLSQIQLVLSWFNKENPRKAYSEGTITLFDSNKIHFNLKSEEGIVEYQGEIRNNQTIELNVQSHINNHKEKRTYIRYEETIAPTPQDL